MLGSPLSYDVRWTCKLIRRDVRNLKAKLQIKLKAKLTNRTKATAPLYQEEIDTIIVEPAGSQDTIAATVHNLDTVRDVLEDNLKEAYASRNIDMPHEDRWKFRGSWLLLYTAVCVSEMPTNEYVGAAGCHRRYDSMFNTRSKSIQPPEHIWHDILEATRDRSKITSTAEDVLGHIWPEKDASEVLDQIGNPMKRLREDEGDELRKKLRGLLGGY